MADNNNRNRGLLRAPSSSWMTTAGLGALTLNSGVALYRASGREDAASSVLFVLGSYLVLLLLLATLRAHERAPPGSAARKRARRAVWPLTTLLAVGFAWKVAAAVPSAAAGAVVWGLAVATSVGGFYTLFVHA